MPMYRAFAPFFKGDKGDRRVTGVCAHSFEGDKGDKRVTGVCAHNQERASGYWFAPPVWL